MSIVETLLVIWVGTYILSSLANTAQRSSEQKQQQKLEDDRQRRIRQLYGRE